MDIGLKIRNMRMRKGYSQEYMADSLNISQKTYSHLENQKIRIHMSRLAKIAEVFELNLIQLLSSEINENAIESDSSQLESVLTNFNKQLEEIREEIRLLRLERQFP